MKKILLTISLLALFFSACQKSGEKSGGILTKDDTKEAVTIIEDANNDLKKIKVIYKENEGKTDELKEAMTKKEVEKVKEITGNLIKQIDEGLILGESAYSKIEKARELNINPSYNEYLDLKAQGLRKQLEAFEYRKKSAQILRDSFGGNDPKAIEVIKLKFKESDDSFQKLMEEGKILSQQANEVAKTAIQEAAQKSK